MHPGSLAFVAALSMMVGCGEPAAPPATPADGSKAASPASAPDAPVVKEGEACGDGMAGRPKAVCATGFVCELTVTPPGGGDGNAAPGKCRKQY